VTKPSRPRLCVPRAAAAAAARPVLRGGRLLGPLPQPAGPSPRRIARKAIGVRPDASRPRCSRTGRAARAAWGVIGPQERSGYRVYCGALGGVAAALPLAAKGQQGGSIRRSSGQTGDLTERPGRREAARDASQTLLARRPLGDPSLYAGFLRVPAVGLTVVFQIALIKFL
jgi:hypothetical protein